MNSSRDEAKPKILVVEDEVQSRKYLQLVLRKKFELDFCETRSSMLNMLDKKKYDVIIMDVSLKNGYSGIELIKELKRISNYKNIPIVCLSAHAYGEERIKAEAAGVEVYLTKPVLNKVLLNTLEKLTVTTNREEV